MKLYSFNSVLNILLKMSFIFRKLKFIFSLKFSNKMVMVPPLYQVPFEEMVEKVIFRVNPMKLYSFNSVLNIVLKMSFIFRKLIFIFLLKFSNKMVRVPPLYQVPFEVRVEKVIFFELFQ